MAWQTPKTNWGQPGQTVPGVDDFNRIEGNIDILGKYDRAPGYGTATGENNKIISLSPAPSSYYDGMCFAFRNEVQNTGPVTINVNGLGARSIKKPNGNDLVSGNLKAGSVYTVRYNGTNFILQGSDSSGNATPDDVRAGKTFSNDDGPDQIGEMPDRGGEIILPGTNNITIPKGYHDGTGYVVGSPFLRPENIRNGVNIFDVLGTMKESKVFTAGYGQDEGYNSISRSFSPGFSPCITIGEVSLYYVYQDRSYFTYYIQIRIASHLNAYFRALDKILIERNYGSDSTVVDTSTDGYSRTGNAFITLNGNINFTTSRSIVPSSQYGCRGVTECSVTCYYFEL